jgi:hypothetical protein
MALTGTPGAPFLHIQQEQTSVLSTEEILLRTIFACDENWKECSD